MHGHDEGGGADSQRAGGAGGRSQHPARPAAQVVLQPHGGRLPAPAAPRQRDELHGHGQPQSRDQPLDQCLRAAVHLALQEDGDPEHASLVDARPAARRGGPQPGRRLRCAARHLCAAAAQGGGLCGRPAAPGQRRGVWAGGREGGGAVEAPRQAGAGAAAAGGAGGGRGEGAGCAAGGRAGGAAGPGGAGGQEWAAAGGHPHAGRHTATAGARRRREPCARPACRAHGV
mmetsp:Transcript_36294/g.94252  ORF Transcript_36294/g.94252 Transcript_36294/m.94252 type:complete len:230 (-) Transcript_36294:1111-1800(-)